MDEFLRVNLGQLLSMIVFIVGGVGFAYTVRGDVKNQGSRLESIEQELHELRKVVVSIARQEERLTAMDQRMLSQGRRIDRMANQLYRYGKEAPEEE